MGSLKVSRIGLVNFFGFFLNGAGEIWWDLVHSIGTKVLKCLKLFRQVKTRARKSTVGGPCLINIMRMWISPLILDVSDNANFRALILMLLFRRSYLDPFGESAPSACFTGGATLAFLHLPMFPCCQCYQNPICVKLQKIKLGYHLCNKLIQIPMHLLI